jgi:hypothetical protein
MRQIVLAQIPDGKLGGALMALFAGDNISARMLIVG